MENEIIQIIGTGPRLIVRCWNLSQRDIHAAFAIWSNPSVTQFMVGEAVSTLSEAQDKLLVQQKDMHQKSTQQWAVELIETQQVIGACGLSRLGDSNTLQLTFCFIPEFHGHGYTTEAGILVCRYGLIELNQPIIAAGTLGDHKASQNVLFKIGFESKGTIVWPDNHQEDPYFELDVEKLATLS